MDTNICFEISDKYLANKIRDSLVRIYSLRGMISQAIPATIKLPKVQNAAMKLNIEPLFDLG